MMISIIIPCYNAEKYIDRCLNSIMDQTYVTKHMDGLEIILVDDASSDGTYDKLLQFEKKYQENVLVIACENNAGPASARNTALKYASGDYISFMDADDMADRMMLERMYEVMQSYDVDVVECAYRSFTNDGLPAAEQTPYDTEHDIFIKINSSGDRGRLILNSFKTSVWGRLYKKSFIEENNLFFPEGMTYGEDNFFSGLAMLTCSSYYRIDTPLYYYYYNENGIIHRSGGDERITELADIMDMYIYELDRRGFLGGEETDDEALAMRCSDGENPDDVRHIEVISDYAAEFEWYMIYKYFMDPVSFVVSRKSENSGKIIDRFGQRLLDFFPEAYDNVYLNSDKRWDGYASLLRQIKKGAANEQNNKN